MKIKMMNKEAQKCLTGYELEYLKEAYSTEWKETIISDAEIASFAALYTGEYCAECLKFSAEMCFSNHQPAVWCSAVFKCFDRYVEASFYLSDAWEATGYNGEELRDRAYIRRFQLVN